MKEQSNMVGQRGTSGLRVWMPDVQVCSKGEGRSVGWWGEGVTGGLSEAKSDPTRPGFCSLWSMRSFSSSRRIPSWNISASSSLEQGNISGSQRLCFRAETPEMPMEGPPDIII